MHAQSHQSDPRILGRRTLQRDHRHLTTLLEPGFAVLDVGCGTGAITAGIARAVGPQGRVVGVDRDTVLLELARHEHGTIPNLLFENREAANLGFGPRFDIVTAARTLQWVADPAAAVREMKQAAKLGGTLVILDYNHAANAWDPAPPPEFAEFYAAFLAWRQANQWDNEMADHLPELFRSAGLSAVESHVQDEVIERGAPEFAERTAIWAEVIESVGQQIRKSGFCTESQLRAARERYGAWVATDLRKQTLTMRTVTGRVE